MSSPSEPLFSRPDGVLIREIDGELLLLNSQSDQYFSLNPVGAQMYSMITGGQSAPVVVQALADLWQVEASVIEVDLNELLETLTTKGLVTRESSN